MKFWGTFTCLVSFSLCSFRLWQRSISRITEIWHICVHFGFMENVCLKMLFDPPFEIKEDFQVEIKEYLHNLFHQVMYLFVATWQVMLSFGLNKLNAYVTNMYSAIEDSSRQERKIISMPSYPFFFFISSKTKKNIPLLMILFSENKKV